MISHWSSALTLLLLGSAAACSSTKIECGGQVAPHGIGSDALAIVDKARAEARGFCTGSEVGCDYTVVKTKTGWSVAATQVFVVDGKCVSAIGGEKIYGYDGSGQLTRIIDGL